LRCLDWEKRTSWIAGCGLFCLCLALYTSHMAPSVVPGDPGEYQIVAARWGIGHPPGYGFYALLGNVFTHLLSVGSFAWRANFLSAVCGSTIVVLAYGLGRMLVGREHVAWAWRGQVPSILGALVLATGLDLWQHAIHANAHIVTALMATSSLFCLVRWWHAKRGLWLYLFCLIAGLSPVQHPLLVFAFPAYAVFVLSVSPRILCEWRKMLGMVGCALLGLTAYLYYPIRCAIGAPPAPGPSDMHTWDGFVRVVTAQGLRVNLGGFSIGDILLRLWDVRVPMTLQYALPTLAVAALGLVILWRRHWQPAMLLSGYAVCIVLITVNVLQDAMAYLLGPVVVVGVLFGVGAATLMDAVHRALGWRWGTVILVGVLLILPLWSLVVNWTRMDMSDFRDADEWLARVEARFEGAGQRAALLTEWERMTTVFYHAAVEGRTWSPEDIEFVYIYAGDEKPFLSAVDEHLPLGPVYLTMYRPQVAQKYRLMPSGDLWQALPAWPQSLPDDAHPAQVVAERRFELIGWQLNQTWAKPGDVLLLDLYMRMPDPEGVEAQQYYLPWARLGETTYRFTNDSRFLTPWWQANEIVVERFELPVPWHAATGSVPLRVGVRSVNQERDLDLAGGGTLATLTDVQIEPAAWWPSARKLESAVGSLRGEILLRAARVNGRWVPSERPIICRPGQRLRVLLEWEPLKPIGENYKVFVQLLDAGLQIRAQGDDKAPLRGSAPTLLWFPRWRRGMRLADSYELDIPADLPPGQYPLVVGMYGFSTFKRVQTVSPPGDMEGDWITLTHVHVE
jgi:hypothetical protein